jgi:16S rRNA (cytosine967-C5)-methyltransferase
MSVVANQKRTFFHLVAALRPHWRTDAALPARIQRILAQNRAIGSRDRRLYRELIFTTLRHLPSIEPLLGANTDEAVRRIAWFAAESPATHAFRAEIATGDAPVEDRRTLLPSWFHAHCPELFSTAELEAQQHRPPLWLRVQSADSVALLAEFDARGWRWRISELLPTAVALLDEVDVTTTDAWRRGDFEVQDLGSQLILETIGIERDGHWLDACAGAGGKTLQLARLLGPGGSVDAHDIRPTALDELRVRALRAGFRVCHPLDDKPAKSSPAAKGDCHPLDDKLGIPPRGAKNDCHLMDDNRFAAIRVLHAAPAATGAYDGVLVDAPCSGSGTWRRAPHLKWTTSEPQVHRAAATQLAILREFATKVKPGGRLVYATCSLSRHENEEVVGAFLEQERGFDIASFARPFGFAVRGNGLTIMPSRYDTDGFFVASLKRK